MSAFPVGKYARYKRATAFFLDWLVRARGRGRYGSQESELNKLTAVVEEIAAAPTSLTPKLLSEFPKALAACQCAITFREQVATYLGGGDSGHRHFLGLLKGWQRTLKVVESEQDTAESESTRFKNYYAVLEVDEDYFPDEGLFTVEAGAPSNAEVDRERLFNEAFAEDLRLEVVYFFLELEELVEGVFSIFNQVKKQQRTMVEATVVSKLAIDTASALTAKLQLRYPALKTAEDVLRIVTENTPKDFVEKLAYKVRDVWTKFQNNGTLEFVPGMLLVDFISVNRTLTSFTSVIPRQEGAHLTLRDGFHGETYGEDRTPEYMLPDPTNLVVFLMQQLPLLYNTITATKLCTGSGYDESNLASSFLAAIDEYFTTEEVTVPIVFTCICWLKSVAALQGNSGLVRNVGLTFKHSKDLMRNMETTVEKGAVFTADKGIHRGLTKCAEEIKLSSRGHNLARANPLMAGFMMLTYHFHYSHMASEILMVTSRFRAFGHLYNALMEQRFLQHIPFFDEVLRIYDEMIFTPSRAAAVHGSYNRAYLLSSHLTATSVNAMYRGVTPPAGKEGVKVRKALHFEDLSQIYRLLIQNDKAVLGGASSKAMLNRAADICSMELFQTRVLSRDMLKLNDDLTDVFSEMCDALNQRQYHNDYIAARPKRGETRQYRVNRALEAAVMTPLMPLLDCLQPDGSLDMSAIPTPHVQIGNLSSRGIKLLCMKAAAVIKAKFATPPLVCEKKYFTFPFKPDFVNQEYGAPSRELEGQARYSVFDGLMTMLEESNGPLSGDNLEILKSELRQNPDLLAMRTNSHLWSLFHQAAAGPAHDADLVEWMIQLGALTIQPLHCRYKLQRDAPFNSENLPNTMAVHSAAIAGHEDIVRIILEADNMVELNTPTYHTKETLAHLAVKRGHHRLYELLVLFGADLRIKDGNGRRVCDVTADREWRRDIAASIAEIERCQRENESKRNRDGLFRHQSDLRADILRRSVNSQRDEERRRELENTNSNAANTTSKKKKNKKKNKKGKATANSSTPGASSSTVTEDSAGVSSLLKDLLVPSSSETDENDDTKPAALQEDTEEDTAAIFARLRDPNIPVDNKIDDVKHACELIKKLESSVMASSHPSRLNSTDRRDRITLVSVALQLIHLMQKLHRVNHSAIAVPALLPVRTLCDTTLKFTSFVVGTAQLSVSVNRKPQATEILDLLEKRLVKMPFLKREPSVYREMVQTYSSARDAMGLGQTSSADIFRALEWYLTNITTRYKVQTALDKFVGRPMYLEFTTVPRITERQFRRFEAAVGTVPELEGVVCLGSRVMYGATEFDGLMRVLRAIGDLAHREKMAFAQETMQIAVTTLYVGRFEFSENGVVKYDAAAA
ncbi:hypothetical protein PPTG_01665 [Phytophthora nicotianae INRA-310]|uniref:DUF6604 domain-containing protein n=1 Tax=Phytophthora nicotianae (strain INRA-310) TaxID=761204 RepID=W2R7X0_PHYN3|nr:hypothetical protein PPTG_01665 [Phytophthora nicotianae INRA-310]ETN21508.1 hypothetical protein PPTG_01665 [Phytophthora nicotianae INRA-310]